jgi:hypothetical protein
MPHAAPSSSTASLSLFDDTRPLFPLLYFSRRACACACVCLCLCVGAQDMFSINPLSWDEWKIVLIFSFPVLLLDEALKLASRLSSKRLYRGSKRQRPLCCCGCACLCLYDIVHVCVVSVCPCACLSVCLVFVCVHVCMCALCVPVRFYLCFVGVPMCPCLCMHALCVCIQVCMGADV